jgi:hypothetical protein
MYKRPELNDNQRKHFEEVWTTVAGSCMINWGYFEEELGLDEDEVAEILDDAEVYECQTCNWWQYDGDICGMHEHSEFTCTDCCEEEDDD